MFSIDSNVQIRGCDRNFIVPLDVGDAVRKSNRRASWEGNETFGFPGTKQVVEGKKNWIQIHTSTIRDVEYIEIRTCD